MADIMLDGKAALGSWNPAWWAKSSGRAEFSPIDPVDIITGAVAGKVALSGSNVAAKGGTTVFRAVDATEAAIIKNTGKFSLQQGGVEAKYFAKSLEDAHWYGSKLYPNGYSVIKGTVKGPVNAGQYWFPHVDIGAYVFPKQTLPYIIPH